jgi:hypothetical protein
MFFLRNGWKECSDVYSVIQARSRWFDSQWDHCILFNFLKPSSCTMALGLTQPLTETKLIFLWIKRGRRIRLTTSLSSVSRLFRKCGIRDVSQPYSSPRLVTRTAFFYFYTHFTKCEGPLNTVIRSLNVSCEFPALVPLPIHEYPHMCSSLYMCVR